MSGSGHRIALDRALANVALEVDMLARKAHAIDEAMGEAIYTADVLEALPLELTQDIDLMRQSADCVNILLKNLSKMTGQSSDLSQLLDAEAVTEGVYLSAIRDRVTSAPVAPKPVCHDPSEWIDL